MTHDELLALLNAKSDSDEVHALRAVVELHEPQEITLPDGSWGHNCKVCDNSWGLCPTLHLIYEELK